MKDYKIKDNKAELTWELNMVITTAAVDQFVIVNIS